MVLNALANLIGGIVILTIVLRTRARGITRIWMWIGLVIGVVSFATGAALVASVLLGYAPASAS